MNIKK